MERVYMIWALLLVAFIVLLIVMLWKEGKIARRHEGAIDEMFRKPSTGLRLGRKTSLPKRNL